MHAYKVVKAETHTGLSPLALRQRCICCRYCPGSLQPLRTPALTPSREHRCDFFVSTRRISVTVATQHQQGKGRAGSCGLCSTLCQLKTLTLQDCHDNLSAEWEPGGKLGDLLPLTQSLSWHTAFSVGELVTASMVEGDLNVTDGVCFSDLGESCPH